MNGALQIDLVPFICARVDLSRDNRLGTTCVLGHVRLVWGISGFEWVGALVCGVRMMIYICLLAVKSLVRFECFYVTEQNKALQETSFHVVHFARPIVELDVPHW